MSKSIIITGAGSGIGRAAAVLFARNGWKVGLVDRNEAAVQALADELGPKQAVPLAIDALDIARLQAAYAGFAELNGGGFDALFNSAGLFEFRGFDQSSLERLHDVVDVNIKGVINSIHVALEFMSGREDAKIVTMSSGAAIYGYPGAAVYSASKFYIRGLTEALNIELAPRGIWVCDVMVAFVDTPLVRDPRHGVDIVSAYGVTIQPEQVAGTVWDAVQGREVHWFVDDNFTEPMSSAIDRLPWNERRNYMIEALT